MPPDRPQIRSLTALRGVAAFAVLLLHVVAAPLGGAAPAILSRGDLGVDLFFYLSGFILAYVYLGDFEGGVALRPTLQFIGARLARIYPVHLFVLFFCLPGLGTSQAFSGTALVYNLLLMQGPELPYGSWYGFSWSISAEWHAYLLFPFIVAPLFRCGWRAASAAAVLSFGLLALSTLPEHGTITATHGVFGLTRVLAEFIVGMLVYRAFAFGTLPALFRSDGALLATGVLTLLVAASDAPDIVIVGLLPLFVLFSAVNDGRISRVLGWRPLVYLGEISYSVYMAQVLTRLFQGTIPVTASDTALAAAAKITACMVLTVLFGVGLHRYIEAPCRRLLRTRLEALLARPAWARADLRSRR